MHQNLTTIFLLHCKMELDAGEDKFVRHIGLPQDFVEALRRWSYQDIEAFGAENPDLFGVRFDTAVIRRIAALIDKGASAEEIAGFIGQVKKAKREREHH